MNIDYLKTNFQKLFLVLVATGLYIQTYPANQYPLLAGIALIPWFLALDKNSWKANIFFSFLFATFIFLVYLWMPYYHAVSSIFNELYITIALIFLHLFSYMLPFIIFGAFYHKFHTYKLTDTLYLASFFTLLSMGLPTLFSYNIATSLYPYPILLQVVDISGVSLLLWCIVIINLTLKNITLLTWKRLLDKDFVSNTILLISTLLFIILYGYWHLYFHNKKNTTSEITIATVQPNMDNSLHQMSMIRDNKTSRAFSHIELTRKALKSHHHVDLIVWPEGGLLVDCDNPAIVKKLSQFVQEIETPLMFQCNQSLHNSVYNQARYIDINGQVNNIYNKQNLIPFFEYIPKIFDTNLMSKEFYHELIFEQGKDNQLFYHNNTKIIPTICYDAHSHKLIEQGSRLGGNVLVIQSNNLIFKKSNIGLFDTATNILTAISFRLPMVKSSNSGYGVFLSSYGEILPHSLTPPNQNLVSVHKLEIKKVFSAYKHYGDWFFWLAFLFVLYYSFKKMLN